jgi:hypothetical protein
MSVTQPATAAPSATHGFAEPASAARAISGRLAIGVISGPLALAITGLPA